MTTKQLAALLNKEGTLTVEGGNFHIPVMIEDVKNAYGRVTVQVRAINGATGIQWVDMARVTVKNPLPNS